ncbi:MAG: AbrB/MazE/SpoVT family DNA-binding domain-containing protein [Alphaproteobacteria bacterium]|nr:AbrB/MazE/SpoVT family DNA-binding domain-containing protein [Alphaproteobacteria bacterium]MBV9901974.1 AbrB/MazE/SpoVT family DNA-binding domain-containing protein [Alphaproteobacteria bacterium]
MTKTFKSGNSVAVRLPKETGLEAGVDVEIETLGRGVVIRPRSQYSGRDLIEALVRLPKPRKVQERDPVEAPERPGL